MSDEMKKAGEPKNTHEACEHILNLIEEVTKQRNRTLPKVSRQEFRQGDLDPDDPRPGNLAGFDRIFSAGRKWSDVKEQLERAAKLHGELCNLASDFRDKVDGTASKEVDALIFRWAGEMVRKLCPPSVGDGGLAAAAAAGGFCTWP